MDDFSRKISKLFSEQFPDWSSLVTKDDEAFEVKIPRPDKLDSPMLEIEAFGDELTVFFGPYHAHFDDYGNNNAFHDASKFIRQITSSNYAIVSYWRREQWCGSHVVKINKLPTDNNEYPYSDTIKILTWSGEMDAKITCNPTD
jgi:hypothetical protein